MSRRKITNYKILCDQHIREYVKKQTKKNDYLANNF